MAITPKEMTAGTLLTATAATLYTVPANTSARVNEMLLCNTDTSARTFTFYMIASGDSAAAKNTIFSGVTIGPGETRTLGLDQVLPAASFIQGLADVTSKIAVRISGVEITQ